MCALCQPISHSVYPTFLAVHIMRYVSDVSLIEGKTMLSKTDNQYSRQSVYIPASSTIKSNPKMEINETGYDPAYSG